VFLFVDHDDEVPMAKTCSPCCQRCCIKSS
jgi:hypothetical protein